jgi:hypothetical protein
MRARSAWTDLSWLLQWCLHVVAQGVRIVVLCQRCSYLRYICPNLRDRTGLMKGYKYSYYRVR